MGGNLEAAEAVYGLSLRKQGESWEEKEEASAPESGREGLLSLMKAFLGLLLLLPPPRYFLLENRRKLEERLKQKGIRG